MMTSNQQGELFQEHEITLDQLLTNRQIEIQLQQYTANQLLSLPHLLATNNTITSLAG